MDEVQFVGTGDAFCSGGRRNSAILLRGGGRTLLLDCGPTTLYGLQSLGIDPRDVDAIAISHFHGDHAAGAPFLLLDYLFDHPRTRPLEIVGPPGIREFTERAGKDFLFDFDVKRRYELAYQEFASGRKLDVAGFTIEPIPAVHHPETRPHMLRVQGPSRSVFFTGDTGWHEALPGHVKGVDLFISECTLLENGFEYHLSHERLHHERARFDCGRVVLTHLGRDVLENEDALQFETAHDGLRLTL